MIVVLSDPENGRHECEQVNQLFEAGLQRFHVRKPEFSELEMRNYLKSIDPDYYPLLVMHQFHELAADFQIQGLHFPVNLRKRTHETQLKKLKKEGFWLSTSIHDLLEINAVELEFDAAFISPVFDSISKPGYFGKSFDSKIIKQKKAIELIALGGVAPENCKEAFEMGYDGVALLGAIWNSLSPTETFKKTQMACSTIDQ